MADTERKFSELVNAGVLTGAEIMAMSQTNVGTLLSVKATLQAIANWFAVNSQYASALDTSNKTLCGAINELKQLISLIPQFSIEVVQTLPTEDISETTIYLVPNSDPEQGNYYEEYIYVNNTWELVGTTAVDLSAYYTKLEVDGLLAAKANTSDVTAALALKEAKADMNDDVTDIIVALTDTKTTAAGNPVTFTTKQAGGAKSALVTFAPKQSGTGDPSPSNIRPISGWDSLHLYNGGKNLFDEDTVLSDIKQSDGSFRLTTGSQTIWTNIGLSQVYCKYSVKQDAEGYGLRLRFEYADGTTDNINLSNSTSYVTGGAWSNPNKILSSVSMRVSNSIPGNMKDIIISTIESNYIPFVSLTTHTATFTSTEYGGEYDFVSGKGSSEWGYIASYNGETLPSEWISDRDVYAEGTTPSTGAEVAYKLATPTEITLTPEDVNLLKGSNTVWTDGDTVQVKYSELPNGNLGAVIDYIQKLEARVKALES